MFFGGGFPFGFGNPHDPHGDDGEEDEEQQTLYSILEVSEDATLEQIQEKHKQLKEKYSSGPEEDPDILEQVNEAFEVLSDPQQKKMYDRQLAQQKKAMERMKGQQGNGGNNKEKPKLPPMKKALDVTLQQLYNGEKVNYFQERARICQKCSGKGGQNVTKCTDCNGEGSIVKLAQVGPGMYTQVQQKCDHCQGMGDIFGEGGKCQTCQGRGFVKKGTDIKVSIPPGAPAGHVITIEGQAADLMLVLREQPHDVYTRKGADLFIKKHISLIQSLLGFHLCITHLDGLDYTFYTNPGDIVGDGRKKIIKGLGMPFFDEPQSRGNLIIDFKVVMPKRGQLNAEQLKALASALPGKINQRPKDANYELLQDFDRESANTNEEGGQKQQDEAEEQQGIGCQAQ